MRVISGSFLILFISVILSFNSFAQKYKVIDSSVDHITVEFDFNNSYTILDTLINGKQYQKILGDDYSLRSPGDPWLPEFVVHIGIPHFSQPKIKILNQKQNTRRNQFIIPVPEEDPLLEKQDVERFNKNVYTKNEFYPNKAAETGKPYLFRYLRILPVKIAPYQFNPVTRDLIFNLNVTVRIDFGNMNKGNIVSVTDGMTDEFLKNSIINFETAKNFVGKSVSTDLQSAQNSYWYDPDKNYFKIYLKEKGVYRITYEQLVSAGAQLGITPVNKLELFNEGLPVPIDVVDNNSDELFNEGDYFTFVGYPPSASPYCKTNIYNLSNVYWFSYESDSSGLHYSYMPGTTANFNRNYISNLRTIHFEKDSLYERLGYATNENRDYWFWSKATANGGRTAGFFQERFTQFPDFAFDSNQVSLRVALQGMTNSPYCNTDHKAYISLTGQPIGDIIWDGQSDVIFDKTFYVSSDSIHIYPTGNLIEVKVKGDICELVDNDEIRINWAEFDYWRFNRIHDKYYDFKNYDVSGINRYFFWQWQGSNVHIYIPSKNKTIFYPSTTEFIEFMDTVYAPTEYFFSATDNFSTPDSIIRDVSSDLRGLSNGADYIIITHSKFTNIANQLANFRQNDFPDESIPNPRIQVVDVQQIYDEFSYGLLNPFALKDFVKYAFENWQSPAPSYVVLLGDMSYDYRGLLKSSRPNFIPSLPYFAEQYGQAASDNFIVAVSGEDVVPDLAIGRLSIETVEQGNILLQKLMNYPDDNTKPWKQNILMLASGLSYQDELTHGFNEASLDLARSYIEPEGFFCSKVFRYPSNSEEIPFQGEGPEIREEINKGATLINYYGHGGGYQWDLTFLNDDIYQLENGGRLPFILSVTCYTSHFDNQDVFGEQFNKVEGKGSIGFYGSAGLTYWGVGKAINSELFKEIFRKRDYVVGKAILNSKNQVPTGTLYDTQIALLTYLGDPVLKLALPYYPDFGITSNDITITPENPVIGDSISVKVKIRNWGTVFPDDSVVVELIAKSNDSPHLIGTKKLGNFPEKDSVFFKWVPDKGGLFNLTAKINETSIIMEEDHSDNIATTPFVIFNISEPNIIKPVNGFASPNNQIDFLISDVGYYLNKEVKYYIEIDTSLSFTSPIVNSGELKPSGPLVKWTSGNLTQGVYFWRSRIFDGERFGNWSPARSFSVMNNSVNGYYAHEKILERFGTYNINYSEETKSLKLSKDPLPARPSQKTLLEHFFPEPQLPDSLHLTALTTDGTYLYFGDIWATASQNDGKSMIYRVGTGNNGTIQGRFYGSFSNFRDSIKNTIAYHNDGHIYVTTGMAHRLVRINTSTGKIDSVDVPPGLLRWDNTTANDGPVYITSDGKYIYNITTKDSLGNYRYTVRILDPVNNWSLAKPDIVLDGSSFQQGMTGFFVHGNFIYPSEYFNANYMRRLRLSDGAFEEEWVVMLPHPSNFQSYYSWCWDWEHDQIYASVYRSSGFEPKFSRFAGYYVDANGTVTTESIGPVAEWNNLKYTLNNPSPTGKYTAELQGLNSATKNWDTLQVNIPDSLSLSQINADQYNYLRINFNLTDSSFTTTQPMELKSVNFDYDELSDIYFEREDIRFEQDSVLQGFPVTFNFKARKIGSSNTDSLNLKFFLNGYDSLFFSTTVQVPADSSSQTVEYTLLTDKLTDMDTFDGTFFERTIRVLGEQKEREYFYFNNLIDKKLFVARDTVPPSFNITFDGKEILDGDIVSAKPEVLISLKDNSPLPLTRSLFTIVHNNVPLTYIPDTLEFYYTPYPNSEVQIIWKPRLEDGAHTLEILAKDSSGNFFDSTSHRINFFVYNETDLRQVYNYPNPFQDNTYFTFELRGTEVPDELRIKIFTVAGRLIQELSVPPSDLRIGFNKIYWNGRDRDGDEIANGLYFYKVISTSDDIVKTVTQKLAKVK